MNKIIKQTFLLLVLLFSFFSISGIVRADDFVQIDFFYSATCPHCSNEKQYLQDLEKNNPTIKINQYEIGSNLILLKNFYRKYKVEQSSQGLVPATFIKEKYFIGYNNEIKKDIEIYLSQYVDIKTEKSAQKESNYKNISVPFVGKLNPNHFALPVLAVTLGILDGFNVCSLGALMLVLAVVITLRSRLKIIIFGSTYLITTALTYGLLIIFWYKIFTYLTPFIRKMELFIGTLTFIGGIYFFNEFIKFYRHGPECGISTGAKITKKFQKAFTRNIHDSKKGLTLIFLVFIFAIVLTIIEFPCSAAVPLAFAGILSQSNLAEVQHLFYIGLFLAFYLLDELILFIVAIYSLKIWMSSPKFITWITFFEAIILFILSFYYFFGL